MKSTKSITSYNTQPRFSESIEPRPWAKAKSVLFCVLFSTLLSCSSANFRSIERNTALPGDGIAVHLDAAQRVLVASKGVYCAEPSPDAIKALAATIGLELKGMSDTDATKLTGSLQEMIAHTGVRTQSTTLMRDALYRICEAYHNGQLEEASVLHLLARSQDLTAVVLAIEQLTTNVFAVSGDRSGGSEESRTGSGEKGNVRKAPEQSRESPRNGEGETTASLERGPGSREESAARRGSGEKEPSAVQEKSEQSESASGPVADVSDEGKRTLTLHGEKWRILATSRSEAQTQEKQGKNDIPCPRRKPQRPSRAANA